MSLDYIVIGKRTDDDGITHLKVSAVQAEQAQTPTAKTREEVVHDIRANDRTYYTAAREGDNFVTKRELHVVDGSTGSFLRTDDEKREADRIVDVPKF